MFRIYEATEADDRLREALQRLIVQLLPAGEVSSGRLERMVGDPSIDLFVAEAEGRIVGMLTLAVYETLTARRGWVEDVVVDDAYRRRGAGRALVDRAIERARERGIDTLSFTSAAKRRAAHALYRSRGFETVDTVLLRRTGEQKK